MSLAQVYNGIGLMYILTMIEQVRTIHNERDRRLAIAPSYGRSTNKLALTSWGVPCCTLCDDTLDDLNIQRIALLTSCPPARRDECLWPGFDACIVSVGWIPRCDQNDRRIKCQELVAHDPPAFINSITKCDQTPSPWGVQRAEGSG
jgi:hypothetical protein